MRAWMDARSRWADALTSTRYFFLAMEQFLEDFFRRTHPARSNVRLCLVEQTREVLQMHKPFVSLRGEHDHGRLPGLSDHDGPAGSLGLLQESPGAATSSSTVLMSSAKLIDTVALSRFFS